MSLGPQCWRCRKKRLRCDSSLPACRKCTAADVECPGYGDKRPIAWRNPVLLTEKGNVRVRENGAHAKPAAASVMGIVCRSPRSVGSELELRITADAMEYYNLHVAPDLVPYATQQSPYGIPPTAVGELADYIRKSYISIVALHKFVSRESATIAQLAKAGNAGSVVRSRPKAEPLTNEASNLSELMAAGDFKSVHFAAQASALRSLNAELRKFSSSDKDGDAGPDLILAIMLHLPAILPSSQLANVFVKIQYSAYAPWQTHVHGAWSLVNAQGGVEALARVNKDHCRVLQQVAVVDIFGMSTHRMTAMSLIFDDRRFDIRNPWALMPRGLATTVNQINMLRAQYTLVPSTQVRAEGLSAILDVLENVSPDKWAAEIAIDATAWLGPGKLSDDEKSKTAWRALMTAFHSATVMYAINSLAEMGGTSTRAAASSPGSSSFLIGRELTAYYALLSSVRILFDQRAHRRERKVDGPSDSATSAGLLHKFVIWPMVIGGIQAAVVHQDEEATGYLCSGMQSVGEELGTVSVIDGARLVEKLWQSHRNGHQLASWDELFDGAPLFLM